jgi:hypothetical protein
MYRRKAGIVLLNLGVAFASAFAVAGNVDRYSNSTIGLAVEKPRGWYFLTSQAVTESRERVRTRDEALGELVRQRARLPLVAMTKYENPEARSDVSPTAQIVLSPLGARKDLSPEDILRLVVAQMQRGFSDFRIVDPIQAATVSGLRAAHMVATYSIGNQAGRSFAVRSRTWLVPRGGFAFIIGMSGPAQGPDVSEAEFSAILETMRIER